MPQALHSKFVPTNDGNSEASIFLLLSIISNGSLELAWNIKNTNKESGNKLDIYKQWFGTTVSSKFYLELAKCLEQSVATISNEKLHSNIV